MTEPKSTEQMPWGKITNRDCVKIHEGWLRFWAKRGMNPPSEYWYGGENVLTASKAGLQRVTKPYGNHGGKQGSA